MFLVHVRLRIGPDDGAAAEAARTVRASAQREDGLEHVSVHAGPGPAGEAVLGLFLAAPTPEVAERRAVEVCERGLTAGIVTRSVRRVIVPPIGRVPGKGGGPPPLY